MLNGVGGTLQCSSSTDSAGIASSQTAREGCSEGKCRECNSQDPGKDDRPSMQKTERHWTTPSHGNRPTGQVPGGCRRCKRRRLTRNGSSSTKPSQGAGISCIQLTRDRRYTL